jgi:molybdate transport system substrate-binding protein
VIRKQHLAAVLVAFSLVAAACGSSSKPAASTSTTTAPSGGAALSGSINVLAASSLTEAFQGLAQEFEQANPGTKVNLSFGASSDLVTQITQGAPADDFASADEANMTKVVDAKANDGTPQPFAKNKLEIAVEKGNPKHMATVADLAKSGTVVVLCDSTVPCGKFADQVLANAKVTVTPKSREANVKATLAKVEQGEADASIVYVTDVRNSGKVDGVVIPDNINVVTTLPIVALKGSKNSALAQAWVDFVVAHQQELVSKYGFLPLS